jgi:hypothetical protein
MYVNDLPDVVSDFTDSALYADNAKFSRVINSKLDCLALQDDLGALSIRPIGSIAIVIPSRNFRFIILAQLFY